jgi:hypothetical protein
MLSPSSLWYSSSWFSGTGAFEMVTRSYPGSESALAVMARVKSIGVHAKHDANNTYVVSLTFEGDEQPTIKQFEALKAAAMDTSGVVSEPVAWRYRFGAIALLSRVMVHLNAVVLSQAPTIPPADSGGAA